MLDMIGANGKAGEGQEAAEKPDLDSHRHWENPFRKSPGPHGKSGPSGSGGAQFWKQPRRWLHVDAGGKTTYVTVGTAQCDSIALTRSVQPYDARKNAHLPTVCLLPLSHPATRTDFCQLVCQHCCTARRDVPATKNHCRPACMFAIFPAAHYSAWHVTICR